MEPVPHRTDVFVFRLHSGQPLDSANRHAIVHHLRRALMALARNSANQVGRLFSGHEPNGRPDSAGHHSHVFLAAECGPSDEDAIDRLIVAAPWAVDRRAKWQQSDQRLFEDVVRQLEVLRAGFLGQFDHLMAEPVEDGDPLLGPARVWTGKTTYVATRNLKKRDDPATVIKADVATECARRGLPTPAEIHVDDVGAGPRGGHPTATVQLRFAVAVRGPLLLGRDSHSGGGCLQQQQMITPVPRLSTISHDPKNLHRHFCHWRMFRLQISGSIATLDGCVQSRRLNDRRF